MKASSKFYQTIIFYALGFFLVLSALSNGWKDFQRNNVGQNLVALFICGAILWMLVRLYEYINGSKDIFSFFSLLVSLVGLMASVGYIFFIEEGNMTPIKHTVQPSKQNLINISGDTMLVIKEGDTTFYKIRERVLIDR